MGLNLERLREARTQSGLTLAQMGERLGVAASQIQRMEKGKRRITLDVLERYCEALNIDLVELIRTEVRVPVIGGVDADQVVHPIRPNTEYSVIAPQIVPRPDRLAAIRWETKGQFSLMDGHLMFFYSDVEGFPEDSWGRRCLVRRTDGSHHVGWPIRDGGQSHIDNVQGRVEFNVQMEWASPILAVFAPGALRT